MKIVLLGFMGCGKTSYGKKLAAEKHLPFFDLDKLIREQYGKSIACIFKEGESLFRKLENETLKYFLEMHDEFILSLGGGTPCFANNMELLRTQNCKTIYLKVSPEELAERLKHEKEQRPLIAGLKDGDLLPFIKEKLKEREPFYLQADETMESKTIKL